MPSSGPVGPKKHYQGFPREPSCAQKRPQRHTKSAKWDLQGTWGASKLHSRSLWAPPRLQKSSQGFPREPKCTQKRFQRHRNRPKRIPKAHGDLPKCFFGAGVVAQGASGPHLPPNTKMESTNNKVASPGSRGTCPPIQRTPNETQNCARATNTFGNISTYLLVSSCICFRLVIIRSHLQVLRSISRTCCISASSG